MQVLLPGLWLKEYRGPDLHHSLLLKGKTGVYILWSPAPTGWEDCDRYWVQDWSCAVWCILLQQSCQDHRGGDEHRAVQGAGGDGADAQAGGQGAGGGG